MAAKIKPSTKQIITPTPSVQEEEEDSSEDEEYEWAPPPTDPIKKEAKLKQQRQIEASSIFC
ncbi:MAG TPA: hypothetical protein VIJ14_02035 [Rhabdochlamydiaceae bacterium]